MNNGFKKILMIIIIAVAAVLTTLFLTDSINSKKPIPEVIPVSPIQYQIITRGMKTKEPKEEVRFDSTRVDSIANEVIRMQERRK